jgi:hypothetical protein
MDYPSLQQGAFYVVFRDIQDGNDFWPARETIYHREEEQESS